MSTLEQGRIVWAEVPSSDGKSTKVRPVVILTATADIEPGKPFVGVAVTTKFTEPLPADQVKLPWHPQGAVRTRLKKPAVAVCSWLLEITEEDINEFGGVVPPQEMLEIVKKAISRDADKHGGAPG